MASNKEQPSTTNPSFNGGLVKSAERTLLLSEKLSLPLYEGKGSTLGSSVERRAQDFAARFAQRRVTRVADSASKPQNQAFYVNVEQNVYSVLSDSKGEPLETGYNAAVGSLIQQEPDYRVGAFTLNKVSETDKSLDTYVGVIATRAQEGDLVEDFFSDRSEFGKIGRLAIYTLAAEYWIKVLGFDPLVPSEYLDITRKEKESLAAYQKRKDEFLRHPIKRYGRMLAEALKSNFTHEKAEAHANALVHLLRVSFKKSGHEWFIREIRRNPKLIPSVQELRRLGKIPDVRIKEFSSLFHSAEWKIVMESPLYKAEDSIKRILKTKLQYTPEPPDPLLSEPGCQDIKTVLRQLDDIRNVISKDIVSKEILHLKKVRLGHATRWRKDLPRDTVLRALQTAPKRINEERVLEDFSPFILAAGNGIPGAETGMTRVRYNRDIGVYQWLEKASGEMSSPQLEEIGQNFVAFLNSR